MLLIRDKRKSQNVNFPEILKKETNLIPTTSILNFASTLKYMQKNGTYSTQNIGVKNP